jgi:hypothetical protein
VKHAVQRGILGTNSAFAPGSRKRDTQIIYKNPVRTSQETYYLSANRLKLTRERVTVYCENHMKHINTLCKQNAEFYNFKTGGTHSNHWTLKG